MYQRCPRCGHLRQSGDSGSAWACPACGLDFRAWLKDKMRAAQREAYGPGPAADDTPAAWGEAAPGWLDRFEELFLYVPPRAEGGAFVPRLLAYLFFFAWGWGFILMSVESNAIGESFMHNINLVFHEAGHVLFRPFGDFMTVLGGTLGQLLMPLAVMLGLLLKNRDTFGASLGLWWLGQSCMDCAPYINDARAGQLMLLGGVTGQDAPDYHDWQNLLGRLGWLQHDHGLAAFADGLGTLLMLLAFAWGAAVLYRQYRFHTNNRG